MPGETKTMVYILSGVKSGWRGLAMRLWPHARVLPRIRCWKLTWYLRHYYHRNQVCPKHHLYYREHQILVRVLGKQVILIIIWYWGLLWFLSIIILLMRRRRTIHQRRVAELASAIPQEMNLSPKILAENAADVWCYPRPRYSWVALPGSEDCIQYNKRLNGSGLSTEMAGDNILLEARIMAVAEWQKRWLRPNLTVKQLVNKN